MKRLLLGPALIAPLALFGCNWGTKTPELPKVPGVSSANEVVRQIPLDDFDQFKIPVTPQMQINHDKSAPLPKPAPRHHVRHKPKAHVTIVPVKPAPEPPLPQQGPICIFPFNMIPNCTPQVSQ